MSKPTYVLERADLEAACRQRKLGAAVRERIMRLNPRGLQDGCAIRGWHPAHTAKGMTITCDLVGKGEFIRKHGREAWDAIPNGMLYKFGRRRYIARRDYLDNMWQIWAGLIPPCAMVVWFLDNRYANDNQLQIEYISRAEFVRRRAA